MSRSFKVVLNSESRLGGSLTDAQFYIRLPNSFLNSRLNLTVDAILHAMAPNDNSALERHPWRVHLTGLNNPFTYDSVTGNTHDIIAVCQDRSYVNTSQKDLGGATVVDKSMFDRTVNVRFSSPHVAIANAVVNDWTLMLSIYDGSA